MRNHKLLASIFSDDDVTIKATLLIVKVNRRLLMGGQVFSRRILQVASFYSYQGVCGCG